jgi:growth factor-regulated tyrosine kinase substrate
VCDGCFIKVKLSKVADKDVVPNLLATSSASSSLTPAYAPPSIKAKTAETNNQQTDDQFDQDLKKAIELSLKESEQRSGFTKPKIQPVEQKQVNNKKEDEEDDPDLAAAIAASLQDMKMTSSSPMNSSAQQYKNSNELSSVDMENIQLFSTLMNRVRSVNGDVSNDPQVNTLYTQIGALQPKLVHTLGEANSKHGKIYK